jgi:hypothetical protein
LRKRQEEGMLVAFSGIVEYQPASEKQNKEIIEELVYLEQLRRVHLTRTRRKFEPYISVDFNMEVPPSAGNPKLDKYQQMKKLLNRAVEKIKAMSEDPETDKNNGYQFNII